MTDASVVVAEPYLRWRGSESGGDGEPQAIPQGSGGWRRALSFSSESRAKADTHGAAVVRAGGRDHLHVGDVDDDGFSTLGILLPPWIEGASLEASAALTGCGRDTAVVCAAGMARS